MRKCTRCNTKVEVEKVLDYPYYCPQCDENLYEVETTVTDTEKKAQ
jgi:predicted RNA-binding Zn-ribbon protein involved in translation (DUF1610 family)